MRSILNKKKKGQIDPGIATFAGIMVFLFFVAPIGIKIVRSTLIPTAQQFENSSNVGMQKGAVEINYLLGVFIGFWDGLIIVAFSAFVLLLFISAFLIDSHPAFMILYLFAFVLTILFAPNMLEAVNNVWDSNEFAEDTAFLSMTNFLRQNFGVILTVIGIMTLIIIFAKIRFFPSGT